MRAAALACVLLCGCVETLDGNGVPGEQTRDLVGFDRVQARGALETQLRRGDFAVEVRIDENLLGRVATEVASGTLSIAFDGGNLGDVLPGPHVLVTLPSLVDLELNGTGRLAAEEFDEEGAVSVELAGSGDVSWSGSTPALDVVLNGVGDVQLAGSASRVDYYVAGGGALEAEELTARQADIEVAGAGSVNATVDGRVDARASGSGVIRLLGAVIEGEWIEDDDGTVTGP